MRRRAAERLVWLIRPLRKPRDAASRGTQSLTRWLASLQPVMWRLTGLVFGLLAYGALWLTELAGAHVLLAPLIVFPVLLFLVAGGNWLQHWLGIERPSPTFSAPARPEERDAADTEKP